MSSTVTMDMVLIGSADLLSQDEMLSVFLDCVKELGGVVNNDTLIINGENLGTLTMNSRIVLSFSTDYSTLKREQIRGTLRETFTRRAKIAHENYIYWLKEEKKRLEDSGQVEGEIKRAVENLEKKQIKSSSAMKRQEMSECEAIKVELMDAAIAQGYEVIENKTSDGIQLQFIRREY